MSTLGVIFKHPALEDCDSWAELEKVVSEAPGHFTIGAADAAKVRAIFEQIEFTANMSDSFAVTRSEIAAIPWGALEQITES